MRLMLHRFILHNGSILDASQPCLAPGQIGLLSGWGVFSTIRVSRGVLFAFDRHFARMRRDAELLRIPFPPDPDSLARNLLRLVDANNAQDATMRVVVVRNRGGLWEGPTEREFDLIAMTADLTNWSETVRLGVAAQARHSESRFAGTKVLSWAFNLTLYEEARVGGFDEVVLLNEAGDVSECTSANIFAVIGEEVRTPPLAAGCLPGVTRGLLLSEIRVPGITVTEAPLTLEDLMDADEIFITSTTRDLLPVESIAGRLVGRRRDVCIRMRDAFRAYVDGCVLAGSGASALQR